MAVLRFAVELTDRIKTDRFLSVHLLYKLFAKTWMEKSYPLAWGCAVAGFANSVVGSLVLITYFSLSNI